MERNNTATSPTLHLASALPGVRARIEEAARRSGRSPAEVRLMAVTKGFPREAAEAALAAGITLLGENRVQEAELKYAEITASFELHLIGHLQRNKARTASGLFSCVQSIDKEETASALESRAGGAGEVNGHPPGAQHERRGFEVGLSIPG